jgi:hypothetical protein
MSYTSVYYMNRNTALHLDIPIDNPYGGPAFGQKLKGGGGLGKVIGVVAAVAAVATGYGALVAGLGPGGSLAGAIAGGAMMAGGVMSGLGTITGNKKLSQIGGVLTLAGGAYGMAFDKAGNFVLGTEGTSLASEGTANALNKFNETFGTKFGQAASTAAKATDTTINLGTDQGQILAAQDSAVTGNAGIDTGTAAAAKTAGSSIQQGGLISGSQQSQILAGQDAGVTGTPGLAKTTINAAGVAPTAGAAAPASNGGLIENILNGKNSGQLIGSAIQGIATGAAGSAQADQMASQTSLLAQKYANDQAELQRQIKNINSPGGIYYNPNDPNAQSIVAAAQASGIKTIPLSVNMNANVQSPTTAFQGAKA